ncbi:MAG TPA: YcnI family protein [Acidimicrobiales bacterium]|nr:YcnI family protein [Acidimicrobiales bacterium]
MAVVLAVVAVPGIAGAHVTLHPGQLPAGATDVELVFRCPNERSDATVVELRVFLPVATPLLGVLTDPPPGWTARARTTTLPHPVTTDDGVVSAAVTEVEWRATSGGTPPGQYEDFPIAVGALPNVTGTLVFKALQTYSNGDVAAWIQVADALDKNPPMPAPVLTLTASPASAPASPSSTSTMEIAALAVAIAALLGVGVLAVVRRRR